MLGLFYPPLSSDVAKVIKLHKHVDKRSLATLLGKARQYWGPNKVSNAILQTSVAASHLYIVPVAL